MCKRCDAPPTAQRVRECPCRFNRSVSPETGRAPWSVALQNTVRVLQPTAHLGERVDDASFLANDVSGLKLIAREVPVAHLVVPVDELVVVEVVVIARGLAG